MQHATATYSIVFLALIGLTALTVGISFLELSGAWHVVCGVSIAAVKAVLVGLFFMHLLHAKRATWAVAVVAIFWLSAVLITLTFSDYATRMSFPWIPGH